MHNAPFTVVLANVGNSDIVGLTGDLAMPINFGAVRFSTSIKCIDHKLM